MTNMSKERGVSDYLQDDWGLKKGGDPDSDSGIPFRENMPPSEEWGLEKEGSSGGYGHSSDVDAKDDYKSWPGIDKDDVARGYVPGKSDGEGSVLGTRQPDGSFPQSIPDTNKWDRGAGSDSYAREHSETTGRGFDGRGNDKPSPGREAMGSSKLVG
jgi:hypothetical protein